VKSAFQQNILSINNKETLKTDCLFKYGNNENTMVKKISQPEPLDSLFHLNDLKLKNTSSIHCGVSNQYKKKHKLYVCRIIQGMLNRCQRRD
jgi:hypothetical protein